MMWGDGMGWAMGWAWLFWILLIVGVVVLVTLLVLVLVRGGPGSGRPDGPRTPPAGAATSRAREILEERYARGEINAEEFHERRRTLEGETP
jgi:putative membrane protein